MSIFKKTYYYNPSLQKDDFGYSVDIYEHRGKKSKLFYCYSDPDYRKVLYFARFFIEHLTKRQK